jgi:RNA polymerase sigma-70 factor (ECF subfamily)
MTARASEAEDLSQETFLRAYRAYRALPEDANVRAWLFAIATNLFRNHVRSEKRRSTFQAAVLAERSEAGDSGPDGESVYRETRTLIEEVVTRLPVKQRTAFVLRKIHELDYDTIARTLDCSADSARAHVFQALRKIRLSLNGHALAASEASQGQDMRAAGRPGAGAPASEASQGQDMRAVGRPGAGAPASEASQGEDAR